MIQELSGIDLSLAQTWGSLSARPLGWRSSRCGTLDAAQITRPRIVPAPSLSPGGAAGDGRQASPISEHTTVDRRRLRTKILLTPGRVAVTVRADDRRASSSGG